MSDGNCNDTELPQALRQGDGVELFLRQRRVGDGGSELRRRLVEDLGRVRSAVQAARERMPAENEGAILASALCGLARDNCIDPVLLYSLARLSALREADGFEESAWQRLLPQSGNYFDVLGELIPEDFEQAARWELAKQAYRDGTSINAVADFSVFLDVLANQRRAAEGLLGVPTGLAALDDAIDGLRGLTMIAADRGVGKTSWAISVVHHALASDPDLAVLFYSLDLSKTELLKKLLSHASGRSYRELHRDPVPHEVTAAADELRQVVLPRLKIIERKFPPPHRGFWSEEFCDSGWKLMRASGAARLLVVVDLFQRMDVPLRLRADPDDDDGVIHLTDDLAKDNFRLDQIKKFRQEFRPADHPGGVPFVLLSEVRKSASVELTRDDLLGSSRLASDADSIILLWPSQDTRADAPVTLLTLKIDKGREGVVRSTIQLEFQHTICRFTEPEKRSRTGASARRAMGVQPVVDPLAAGR